MKIGVMFGNPETTTGGNALKFYASVRLDIRRIQAIKDGENVIGNRTRVKVVKNKLAPPFKEIEFDILYGEGISKEGDILDLAANHNLVEKSGTWFSYQDERMGQGREKAIGWLKDHPEVMKTLRKELLEKSGIGAKPVAATAAHAMKTDGPLKDGPLKVDMKMDASKAAPLTANGKPLAAPLAAKVATPSAKK
jgi:recombination protein RecA